MGKLWVQTVALAERNLLLKLRKSSQTLQEFAFPLFFISILLVLSIIIPIQTYPPAPFFPPTTPSAPPLSGTRVVAYAPGGSSLAASVVERALVHLNASFPLVPLPLADGEEIEAYFQAHPGEVWAGLTLELEDPSHPAFHLRMNASELPSTSTSSSLSSTAPPTSCRLSDSGVPTPCPSSLYLSSGFLALQGAVNLALVELVAGVPNATLHVRLQQMPQQEYRTTNRVLSLLAAIYSVLALSPILQSLLVNLIVEKELHVVEAMVTMGMSPLAHLLSWVIVYAMLLAGLAIMISLIMTFVVVPKTNILLLFLLFFLFGMSLVAIAFLLSPLFSRSRPASFVGLLLPVIFSIIFVPIGGLEIPASPQVLYACSLLSPVALPLALFQAMELEIRGYGLTFETISQDLIYPGFSVGGVLGMLLVDSILYTFLAWYLEKILPSLSGTKLPPWFLFSRSYWFPPPPALADHEGGFEEALDGVEPIPQEMESGVAIRISGIKKTYTSGFFKKETKEAIKGISLNINESQIFGLLGHNGAGKSSLIKILSGIIPPTSGSIKIFGLDTRTQMAQIRSMIGICPQENILFDELTVFDHLRTFAGVRGLKGEAAQRAIGKALREIGLKEKRNVRACKLSGGQKRRLCLGLALVGDPRLIFLDEPTAGVDPVSRRKLWEMLQEKKRGHVIILTTHSMDEADILCERKAIISHGQVRCVGSSLFLKSRFGLGYRLTLTPAEGTQPDHAAITTLITSQIPLASPSPQQGPSPSYTLPLKALPAFPALFATIEQQKELLGLESYVVSMASLEEIFLNLELGEASAAPTFEPLLPPVRRPGQISHLSKFWVLFKFRMLQILRNPMGFLFSVIIPLTFLCLGFIFYTVLPTPTASESPLILQKDQSSSEAPLPFANSTGRSLDDLLTPLAARFAERPPEVFYESFNASGLDEIWGPSVAEFDLVQSSLNFLLVHNASYTHAMPIALQEMSNSFFSLLAQEADLGQFQITAINDPFPFKVMEFDSTAFTAILMIGTALICAPIGFASDLVKERQKKIKHQLYVQGFSPWAYWLSAFMRDIFLYAITASLVLILASVFEIEALSGPSTFFVFVILACFIPSMLVFVYVISMMFDNYESCQIALPQIVNLLALIPYILVATIDFTGDRDTASILHFATIVWNPAYAVMGGLHFIGMVSTTAKLQGRQPTFNDYASDNMVIPTILTLIADFFGLLFAYSFYLRYIKRTEKPSEEKRPLLASDVEMQNSDLGVNTKSLEKDFPIEEEQEKGCCGPCLCHRPERPKKVILDHVNFQVRKGECFGLLGPNGAGKTTLLNILTGSIFPTSGEVHVAGFDIVSEPSKVFQHLGYCPQEDALFDDLTISEHLELYGRVKGIPTSELTPRINSLISLLGMGEHRSTQTQKLSGGTKRKLSFAISLIADPSVIILDEPSSGMDPASRRKLREVMRLNLSEKACILTTHSMEEAEELASPIGIFVKGRFECIGTAQQLKDLYGQSYQLDIKVPFLKTSILKNVLREGLGRCELLEEHFGRMTFKIVEPQIQLSTIFQVIEQHKEALEIEDYTVSQPTLEQVFLVFAKKQAEE